jgi:hypothetical protein
LSSRSFNTNEEEEETPIREHVSIRVLLVFLVSAGRNRFSSLQEVEHFPLLAAAVKTAPVV